MDFQRLTSQRPGPVPPRRRRRRRRAKVVAIAGPFGEGAVGRCLAGCGTASGRLASVLIEVAALTVAPPQAQTPVLVGGGGRGGRRRRSPKERLPKWHSCATGREASR